MRITTLIPVRKDTINMTVEEYVAKELNVEKKFSDNVYQILGGAIIILEEEDELYV